VSFYNAWFVFVDVNENLCVYHLLYQEFDKVGTPQYVGLKIFCLIKKKTKKTN